MLDREDLDTAVRQGVISDDQCARILAISRQRHGGMADYASPDEPFRLFRGFRDFFLAIGLAILAIGMGASTLVTLAGDAFTGGAQDIGWSGAAGFAALAAIGWLFGELVTRRLRLPLSSMVVALAFCGAVGVSVLFAAAWLAPPQERLLDIGQPVIFAALAAVAGAAAFYWRFRLPFVLLLLAGAAALAVYTMARLAAPGFAETYADLVLSLLGLSVFVGAMAYDLSDPPRLTRRSECAFWLHLLAAPLLLNGAIGAFRDGLFAGNASDAIYVLAIVAVLGLIALLIDRRALLVSGLLYLGVALSVSLDSFFAGTDQLVPSTLLVLGAVLVALGLGWTPARRALLAIIPDNGLLRRLPPPAYES